MVSRLQHHGLTCLLSTSSVLPMHTRNMLRLGRSYLRQDSSTIETCKIRARLSEHCTLLHTRCSSCSPVRQPCGVLRLGRRYLRQVAASAATVEPAAQEQQLAAQNGAASGTALTFQEAIVRLQEYWSSKGCALWQPHNSEVGAGTMNPATFLRVAGPEGWKVCYVEPSIRPDDSRYGENPNRLQQHTQMQVILKPDPGNPQELYLGSLQALGVDTRLHDVRFVEDNWENPALGAWGLGWEVWMDGQEITQFTYFQQAGGHALKVPSVEITYGLERILTALQGVDHFKDIRFNGTSTYGQMLLQQEYEMSCFNLEQADIAVHQQLYDLYEKEAGNLLQKKLPIPAYQQLLKLSHCFNILDARGAIGVTQRAKCFATMRRMARQVTELWLLRRAELEHPLGTTQPIPPASPGRPDRVSEEAADLVVEIGCEELPPADAQSACQQLRQAALDLLQRLRLEHGEVRVESTPRRLVLLVKEVAGRQGDLAERSRGPPVKAAFGKDGAPTKALDGFCSKNGVSPESVTREADAKGVEYVFAVRQQSGRAAAEVLTEELGSLPAALSFQRSMRWNGGTAFSRPVRWLLALHGSCLLPFAFAGLQAGRASRGLRNSAAPDFSVHSVDDYWAKLAEHHIMVDGQERRAAIWQEVQAAAAAAGGTVPEGSQQALLSEVTDLVEAPRVLLGAFDPAFLSLPEEVLVMVMRKHQRYFPVYSASSTLQPNFVTVANGPVDAALVIAGNEAVLQARFQDALFFYNSDLKQPLQAFKPALAGIVFQKDLGTIADKSDRLQKLVPAMAALTGLQEASEVAAEAAGLAKADLATSVVTEMTALAGIMGRHYALKQGVSESVAQAIFEAVLPRQAGDELPSTAAGILCSLADRLDSLVGLFAAGHAPTASADIYGLRRSAYGMLETLLHNGTRLDLREAVSAAAALQSIAVSPEMEAAVLEFVARRLEQLLVDSGISVEVVKAVLDQRANDPWLARQSAQDLQAELDKGQAGPLHRLTVLMSRPTRLMKGKHVDAVVDAALFECDEERRLHENASTAAALVRPDMTIPELLQACDQLEEPINTFFDNVFVMCDDARVQQNRLALLQTLVDLTKGIVNLTHLPGY